MIRLSLLAVCALLAACGQTGPLYLPDQAPPKSGLSIKPDTRNPGEESRALKKPDAAPAPSSASSVTAPPSAGPASPPSTSP